MSVKVEVKMTEKAMYGFLLYHNYTHFGGIFSVVIGLVAIVTGVNYLMKGDANAGMLALGLGAVVLVYTPLSLKMKAKQQIATSPMFQQPIGYEMTDEKILITQGDATAETPWSEVMKAVSTPEAILLYTGRLRAIILPKSELGEQLVDVIEKISKNMPPAKVKIRTTC